MLEDLIETLGPFIVLGIPVTVIAYQHVRAQRQGGMVSLLVGARVSRTVGEVAKDAPSAKSVTLRVHRLAGGDPRRVVAVELDRSVTGPLGSRMAAALSVDEAEALITLLEDKQDGRPPF